jgi:hypothetical protein
VTLPVRDVLDDIHESQWEKNSKYSDPDDVPTTARDVYVALHSISSELARHIMQEPSRLLKSNELYLPFPMNQS